ncbi:MAG: hypothetical protein WCK58_14590, partial [Chloroflexota bacterium]
MSTETRSEAHHPLPPPDPAGGLPGTAAGHRSGLGVSLSALAVGAVLAVAGIGITLVPGVALDTALRLNDLAQDAVLVAAIVALLAGYRTAAPGARGAIAAVALVLGAAGVGMVIQDTAGSVAITQGLSDVLFLVAVVLFVGFVGSAISEGLPGPVLVGAWLDALILFIAATTVVGMAGIEWLAAAGHPVGFGTLVAVMAMLVLGAWSATAWMVLLVRGMPPVASGPYAVLAGGLAVAVSALAWQVSYGDGDVASIVVLTEYLVPAGVLAAAYGALTWSLEPRPSRLAEAIARVAPDGVPVVAVMVVLITEMLAPATPDYLFVRIGLVVVILIAGARFVLLKAAGRRVIAYAAEMQIRLTEGEGDRDATLRSMARLEAGDTLAETACRVCEEALGLDGIDVAWLSLVGDDGAARVLAVAGLPAGMLLGRAADPGPGAMPVEVGTVTVWSERPDTIGSGHLAELAADGVKRALMAPFRWEERLV